MGPGREAKSIIPIFQLGKTLGLSILLEPVSDLIPPDLDLSVMLRIMLFEALEKTLYELASGGKDGQANEDKEYPLKEREKDAEDPQNNKDPANDKHPNLLDPSHCFHFFDEGRIWLWAFII